MLMDLAVDEIILTHVVAIVLIVAGEPVSLVSKDYLASELMVHCADHDASELVIILIPGDFTAISKGDLLVAKAFDLSHSRAHENPCLKPARHCEVTICTLGYEMTARWVIRGLLQENFRAILTIGLVGFAEDGVKRLQELLTVEEPAEVT